MDFNKLFQSKIFKVALIVIGAIILFLIIFKLGMFIGEMKARFSYRWAESYHKNFAGPQGGFFGDWRKGPLLPGEFIEGHGAFGEIIEFRDSSFVIKGGGDVEKLILITKDTVINKGRETIKGGLKVGDRVVIIGSPNNEGQIEARLIRIFDGEDVKSPPKLPRLPFLR